MSQGISVLVHGRSKSGKSTFGATSPAPRLILDAESGSRFVPGTKVWWDPLRQAPPQPDGTWESCMVAVHDYQTVTMALQWLQSGMHPFNSVVIDSISEVQQRAIDSLVGIDPMKQQEWGTLLRMVSSTVRQFRDLVTHPTRPLWAVVYIAMTGERTHKWMPLVQGQLRDVLPYYVDICGYLFVNPAQDASGAWPGNSLLVSQHPEYEAGERVGGVLGPVVVNPTVTGMLRTILASPGAA